MATTRLYLDQRTPRKDGTCPLKLAISKDSTTRHLPLNVYLRPDEWDSHAQRVIRRRDRLFLNNHLAQRQQAVDAILLALTADGTLRHLTAAQLKERIAWELLPADERQQQTAPSFPAHLLRVANNHTGRTRDSYLGTYRHVLRYAGDNAATLSFAAISRDWLVGFDRHLAATSPSRNARNVHLRNIRAVFNDAIDNDLTTAYPFRRFHIKAQETAHRTLTVEQLRQLFSYPCEAWQQQYVDMFKLIFFLCGINIADLCALQTIVNGRIEYRRAKTHKLYSIKVEHEAQEIIDRYRGQTALLNIADRYTNHANYAKRLNSTVQHLGTYHREGRGGKKVYTPLFPTITTYWMRHTWATIAADLDIPVDTISRALGHSQTTGARVTSVYINFNRRKIDDANRRVLDYVLYNKR